jgi:uncharacterized protein YyaL (SSP411 family)
MTNRLADAISPYLRSHAENPVDWYPWGPEAFAAAAERDVPVLVSIGYATCHWCHVMARESFSDPQLAAFLNERFVAIKVDREEHPEVDTVYLAAAGAFTQNLGWPLNVFVTPEGKAFYGGTYSPPVAIEGHPSFRQVLEAVTDAWTTRHDDVLESADAVAEALAAGQGELFDEARTVGEPDLERAAGDLARYEDLQYGGFGGAPKFPVAPVLRFLLELGSESSTALALRTLRAMAASDLRDSVEGGFFRYATMRDWSDPHYERMLYDNALLLDAYTAAWLATAGAGDAQSGWAHEAAEGIARFLIEVMQLPSGGFASAQDSESTVDGVRVEGGYYRLDAAERARQTPPALDEKVLSGWNGLAIGALGHAALVFGRDDWAMAAEHAADYLLEAHVASQGTLVRASLGGRVSAAAATLEDYGMLAEGLLRLAAVTGSTRYATVGRMLVDVVLEAGFRAPGGGDPLLRSQGLAVDLDPSEGAYPSGTSAMASAALLLHTLTAQPRYREAAEQALAPFAAEAEARPISFGATLGLLVTLGRPAEQLVLIEPDAASLDDDAAMRADGLRAAVRMWAGGAFVARATEAQARMLADGGFELFADRTALSAPTAYRCFDFVCRLPATGAAEL